MAELYLEARNICAALAISDQDWRSLRRILVANIATRHPRRNGKGPQPLLYSLDDVVSFAASLPNFLTYHGELQLRDAAEPF